MDQCGTRHLMIVGNAAISVILPAAVITVYRWRRKIPRPILEQLLMPHPGKPRQSLAPLPCRKHFPECASQQQWVHFVQSHPHRRITGSTTKSEQFLQVVSNCLIFSVRLVQMRVGRSIAMKNGEARHPKIRQSPFTARIGVRNLLETISVSLTIRISTGAPGVRQNLALSMKTPRKQEFHGCYFSQFGES